MAQNLSVWASGAWQARKNFWVRASAAWQPIQGGWVWESGAWQKFYTPLVIALSSTNFTSATNACGVSSSPAAGSTIHCDVSGGTAPYTIQMTKLSGGSELTVVNPGPNSLSTGVSCQNTAAVLENGVFRITCTDANGASNFVDITIACQHL